MSQAGFLPKPDVSRPEFLSLGTIGILGWVILCCGTVLCTVKSLAASLVSTH